MKGRKEEIITEAAKLFMRNGYEGTSMAEISNAVGLGNPSGLFAHFKGKEEIYKAAVDKYVIHTQTPKQKFGDCLHLSLKEFIEVYMEKVEKTMDFLRYVAIGSKASNRYFSFMLESGNREEECANAILLFDSEEVELWQAVIEHAQKTGEVQPHLNALDTARLFRYAFAGMSYMFAVKDGVSIAQLRELLHGLYNTIKK